MSLPELTQMQIGCLKPALSISKIDLLPVELMQIIFRLVATKAARDPGKDRARNRAIILSSHVSCLWRDIALGDPYLWSIIPVATSQPSSVEYFQTFIQRSGSHRLAIDVQHVEAGEAEHSRFYAMLDAMYPHATRIQELAVSGCEHFCTQFYDKLDFAAPALETFRLHSSIPHPLYGSIFSAQVPALRRLELSGWNNWAIPKEIFREITHLTLAFNQVLYVPLPELIQTIGWCSQLEHLALRLVTPRPSAAVKPVTLVHLQTLLLDRCDPSAILSFLNLPAKLNLTVWEDPESSSVMLLPTDCSNLRSLDDLVKLRLVVRLEDMVLIAQHRNGSIFECSQVAYLDNADGDYDEIVAAATRFLFRVSIPRFRPLDNIQECFIECEKFEPETFTPGVMWREIFQRWTALSKLTLRNFPVEEVMLALTPDSQNILCPQLEVVQLETPEANLEIFIILTKLFQAREARGGRISTLRLKISREDCRTYKEEIRVLKACVHSMQVYRI